MTRCICSSLLTKKCFDATDMVQTFAHEYRQNGNRGYGGGMLYLFDQWNHNGVTCDPFSAAKEQFSGKRLTTVINVLISRKTKNSIPYQRHFFI